MEMGRVCCRSFEEGLIIVLILVLGFGYRFGFGKGFSV